MENVEEDILSDVKEEEIEHEVEDEFEGGDASLGSIRENDWSLFVMVLEHTIFHP